MTKKLRGWNGTSQRPRNEEERKKLREWEALSPEEKRPAQRKQFISWLDLFQREEPILHMNGKAQAHSPMAKEHADLHLALFDKEIEPTPAVRILLAQLELVRFPDSPRHLYRYWKLQLPNLFNSKGKTA